jgi:hypothetical protein
MENMVFFVFFFFFICPEYWAQRAEEIENEFALPYTFF